MNHDGHGDGNDHVFRLGKGCATQGALFHVALNVDMVVTTPERHYRPLQGLETHWTLVHY